MEGAPLLLLVVPLVLCDAAAVSTLDRATATISSITLDIELAGLM